MISLVTTQVFPPAVAQLERSEKVETEDVARSRGCGKSWPNGCLVLPVLFNVDARPCPVRSCTKEARREKREEPAHEGSPWAGARVLDWLSLQVPEGAASELKTAAASVSGRDATECEGGRGRGGKRSQRGESSRDLPRKEGPRGAGASCPSPPRKIPWFSRSRASNRRRATLLLLLQIPPKLGPRPRNLGGCSGQLLEQQDWSWGSCAGSFRLGQKSRVGLTPREQQL